MKNLKQSADYFTPLMRGRVTRALKALRQSVHVRDIAMAIAHKNPTLIHVKLDLTPAVGVLSDALRQGGKIGAQKVNDL